MSDRVEYKREIGLCMAVTIGIGAMVGPGIFALPGELAKTVGPLGAVVHLAIGPVTVFTALNYSELSIVDINALSASCARRHNQLVPRKLAPTVILMG